MPTENLGLEEVDSAAIQQEVIVNENLYLTDVGPSQNPVAPYDLFFSLSGVPDANELIGEHVITRDLQVEVDMVTSTAVCLVAPTADATFSIQIDDVEVGTILFELGSTVGSFTYESGDDFSQGDRISIVSPVTPDLTIDTISVCITTLGSI